MTTLRITPLENKGAYVTGCMAVAETVRVSIVGYSEYAEASPNYLRIRVISGRTEIARFPLSDDDAWTSSDGDAVCDLSLNTVQALALFGCASPDHAKDCFILVEITEPNTLKISTPFSVKNWPQASGDDVPYDLTDWPDDRAAVEALIADLEAAYEIHTHADGDPVQVDHANLLNIGTATHTEIDAAIAALQGAVATDGEDIDRLEAAVSVASGLIASHNHNGVGSQQLSHAGLSGIGTLTHDQIETALTAVDAKVDANKALYDAHAHTGSDGTPQIALAAIDGWSAMLARLEAAEGAIAALVDALAVLDAEVVKQATTQYTVTAPALGTYRNINEDMTGDQLARSIPTIVADLQAKGVL